MVHAGQQTDAPAGVARDRAAQVMARWAEPLPDIGEPEFARRFDRLGDARVVILGAATDGSSELLRARAAITRWLIEQRGVSIVAMEADWSDVRVFDAFVRGREAPRGPDGSSRFPAWRWRNAETLAFLEGLKHFNASRGAGPMVSLYGLDLYDGDRAKRAVVDYLDRLDPAAADVARRRFGGQTPWMDEPFTPGRSALTAAYARHERAAVATLAEVAAREAARLAEARVLAPAQARRLSEGAARHYQTLFRGGIEAWNRRAAVMLETLDGVLARKGSNAKAVVWAHGAQAGDAAATELGLARGGQSLGGLCRGVWGREAALVGLDAHAGVLTCARDWDVPGEARRLGPAEADSLEAAAHATRIPRFLLDLRATRPDSDRAALDEPRPQRLVGPVYRPGTERVSHYVEARLAQQFDAWVWFDETHAVDALPPRPDGDGRRPWPFDA